MEKTLNPKASKLGKSEIQIQTYPAVNHISFPDELKEGTVVVKLVIPHYRLILQGHHCF